MLSDCANACRICHTYEVRKFDYHGSHIIDLVLALAGIRTPAYDVLALRTDGILYLNFDRYEGAGSIPGRDATIDLNFATLRKIG